MYECVFIIILFVYLAMKVYEQIHGSVMPPRTMDLKKIKIIETLFGFERKFEENSLGRCFTEEEYARFIQRHWFDVEL